MKKDKPTEIKFESNELHPMTVQEFAEIKKCKTFEDLYEALSEELDYEINQSR